MAINNNYNASDNTNPGFNTGNNATGQTGGIATATGGNNFDVVQWLQNIAQQMNTTAPAQASNAQGGMAIAPSQQIMQDVAKKTLTKHFQEHADATPPQVLANLVDQWTQNGGANPPETGGSSSNGSKTKPPTGTASTAPSIAEPQGVDQQIEAINKQAVLNIADRNLQMSKSPDFMQRFSQNFSKMNGGVTQSDQLVNMGTVQKLAGGEPLQNKDIADLTAGTYKAGLEATHQALAVEGQKFTALEELYSKLDATKGRVNQALATPSDEQKTVYKSLQTTAKNINTHVSNLGMLINNRPKFSNQGVNTKAQGTVNKIKAGQTATNPKTGEQKKYEGGQWITVQ